MKGDKPPGQGDLFAAVDCGQGGIWTIEKTNRVYNTEQMTLYRISA